MHAFLIQGEFSAREAYIHDTIKQKNADYENISLAKIADVKEVQKNWAVRPRKMTYLIIRDLEKASIEAQNAFLKFLEEPQNNLFFLISVASKDRLLPTIQSRAKLVSLKRDKKTTSESAKNFLNSSIHNKLVFIDTLKTRDDAISFVGELLTIDIENKNLDREIVEKTYYALSCNANVNLALTYLVSHI